MTQSACISSDSRLGSLVCDSSRRSYSLCRLLPSANRLRPTIRWSFAMPLGVLAPLSTSPLRLATRLRMVPQDTSTRTERLGRVMRRII